MIDDDWRIWIADNLRLGQPADELVATLRQAGFDKQAATDAVDEALYSPLAGAVDRLLQRVAKRDWVLSSLGKLETLDGAADAVPRISAIDPAEFFATYYHASRPVILTGMIDHWPAMKLWSLDYFAQKCGNPEIEVQWDRGSEPDYEVRSHALRKRTFWADLLRLLADDPHTNDFYVTANNGNTNREALACLWNDIGPLPGILDPDAAQDGFFWLGPRGTITPWHHDLTNNLLVQIRGRKRVTLASATQTPKMKNFRHCFSGFGGDADVSAEPEPFRPATIGVDLEPGEALFLPVGWWHHVEGLELSIGLSFTNFVADNDFASGYTTYGDL